MRRPCPACRSPRSGSAFVLNALEILRCRACRSLFLADPPDGAALERFYEGERYFANPDYPERDYLGYRDYLADREEIERKFEHVLDRVEEIVSPGRLVDVGAGPGLLVAVAERRGWDAMGVDLNSWAARFAREALGVRVEVGSLESADLDGESIDAVAMMDFLEHAADADGVIQEAARVTRPGGVLTVLTPDAGSLTTRVLGRRWPEVQRAPEHTVLYSVRGLGALLQRHGYEPLGWHWIGKTTTVGTLVADLSLVSPRVAGRLIRALDGSRIGNLSVTFDPRAKFCLYARRAERTGPPAGDGARAPGIPQMGRRQS